MGKYDKLIFQIVSATSDANIAFFDLINLLQYLGFEMRIKGSHHIFREARVEFYTAFQGHQSCQVAPQPSGA